MHSDEMLAGFKGLLPLPGGKVLVAEIMDRYLSSGRFRDPVLVGPARVYAKAALPGEIVDCDGSIAETLQTAVRVIEQRFSAEHPVGMTTCDVLPSVADIRELLAAGYDPITDCVFWGEFIEAQPARMGASEWKPFYSFTDPDGGGLRNVYPGHLMILRAAALNVDITIALARLAYLYRNRPLLRRLPGMMAHGVAMLARYDFTQWLRGRWSASACSVPWECLRAYGQYRGRRLGLREFEQAFTRTFVRKSYRHAAAGRPARFVVSPILSFAKDLDTKAEFAEVVRSLSCDSD